MHRNIGSSSQLSFKEMEITRKHLLYLPMWLLFLMFFVPLCWSRFHLVSFSFCLTDLIFNFPAGPMAILLDPAGLTSPSHLKSIFSGYRVPGWEHFPSTTLKMLLFSHHLRWEICSRSYYFSCIYNVFFPLVPYNTFFLLNNLVITYISVVFIISLCLGFSELRTIDSFHKFWKIWGHIFLTHFSYFPPSPIQFLFC